MKRIGILLASVWLGTAAAAQATSLKICDVDDECANSGSQAELKACIGELRDAEDRRLNQTYRDLISAIEASGIDDPQALIGTLRQSQRNWLVYRDDYCWFRFSTAQGGTIGGLLLLDCECTLTRDKADHLKDDLEAN